MPKLGFKIDGRPAEDIVHLAQLTEKAGKDQIRVVTKETPYPLPAIDGS
ncbi:hypothetical protein [Mycolicibacterium moriokaense]|uniref:Uncharacterized protein n=1 Tax=Mycolicibacterium moriokaense TaxID=39691 RepID=A0A318HKZ9_9MYCO|nr:hypothetical protein [Mycolicibacterium moriokaense]PXX03256.1 hypothetical protein C8E89_12358 [Mycolicibacterium moriokaense]